ncbi:MULTISPECIES: OmpH family outer membrane protein [Dyadobacter]|jgi:outer membrane protein|uniref:OmpH family outer membrane protein n=1 Tax=Dyadobacter chenhuakuii TaxID=2909339 RepID=A0A9X1QEJ0_9BACT|nr:MULTISPECIES: OmpH family outer membrane protein [Dyadobacter]MCE7069291.1 OmpH family outer membrane protein [Dyadobacter sp. CY327]MCF2495179.1 OmpH family outer membrane protein [Dyadobacter chenhuakuii]MCF2500220.1 OmpH family outer membrane protein [Dyadobacter chenhuakuii]MCF2516238.1 OmpH family outer membrane protein [Dyadobacter sp. CY351]USJ29222.1 OmpH family outer membrane protein [Dyadobacter chenhuakuii]
MKQKLIAFLVVMTIITTPLLAQTTPASGLTKIGYTNVDYIIGKLPESKVMQNQLEVTKAQLDKALGETYKEAQEKYEAYQKNGANMTDVIRADKEKELQNLQTRIQEMQNNAQTSLQTKQQQLLEPILTKVNNAIQEVGKESGFLYILNMDAGAGTTPIILFAASEDNNATNLILRKLGVDPDKIEAAAPAAAKPGTAAPVAAPAKTGAAAPATTPAATTPKKK